MYIQASQLQLTAQNYNILVSMNHQESTINPIQSTNTNANECNQPIKHPSHSQPETPDASPKSLCPSKSKQPEYPP
jgi:hypothetical protein